MKNTIQYRFLPILSLLFPMAMAVFSNSWAFGAGPDLKQALIRDIKINNAYPLFNRDVERAMTIYVGDPFDEKKLMTQEKGIMDLYRTEGYLPGGVSLTAIKDKRKNAYTIHVVIRKGPYLRLGRVAFSGNRNYSKGHLLYRMASVRSRLYPGQWGRFRESECIKDVERLTRFYRKKGFADAVIRHEFKRNIHTKRVDVDISIEEGPRYVVRDISGNEAFYDRTLKKELVIFEKGNRYGLGMRKSVENIKARYREKGYSDVRIEIDEVKKETRTGEKRRINMIIHEGEQGIVERVILDGNHYFSAKRIQKEVLTAPPSLFRSGAFLEETLSADIMAIKALYLNEGFSEAAVSHTLEWSKIHKRVIVRLTIDEGPRTMVSSVHIKGNSILTEAAVFKIIRMRKGEPFTQRMLAADETELAAALAEKGYPHVSVTGEAAIASDKQEADVIYHIDSGESVKMGEVYLRGDFRTKERVIRKELEMEKGEPFSLKKMVAAQKNIRDLNIFESVRFDTLGLREKEDTVHLMVDVVEAPPYYANGGVGYESERGLYMHAKVGDQNLFGQNKKVWLSYESSEIGYHGETGFVDHRFLGYRTDLSLTFYSEREQEFNQDFETRTKGATLGFTRKPWKKITTGLNLSLERREQVYDDSALKDLDASILDKRTVIVTTPMLGYDSRDGFIRPRKGILSSFAVDISRGIANDLDSFYKWRLDNRFYITPFSRVTLAFCFRSGFLIPSASNREVPEDQLFFLGGTSSVRGFRENRLAYDTTGTPVGGRTAFSTSLEWRFEVRENLELDLFYDAGLLLNTPTDQGRDRLRDAVGTGVRWLTPIGPVGFLYGVKTHARENESSGQWHFSIGYTF